LDKDEGHGEGTNYAVRCRVWPGGIGAAVRSGYQTPGVAGAARIPYYKL